MSPSEKYLICRNTKYFDKLLEILCHRLPLWYVWHHDFKNDFFLKGPFRSFTEVLIRGNYCRT